LSARQQLTELSQVVEPRLRVIAGETRDHPLDGVTLTILAGIAAPAAASPGLLFVTCVAVEKCR
jgi:hypothetical protein